MIKETMYRQLLALALLVTVLCGSPLLAQEQPEISEPLAEKVKSAVDRIKSDEGYPGVSLAVYSRGEPLYFAQSGYANVASKVHLDSDTVFRIYSLTKGVTQILAAILADDGLLDLDAPISRYVPDLPEHVQTITAQQLLRHRAGIRHYENDQEWLRLSQDHCGSPEDAFNQFLDDPLVAEPGTATHYSSFGYVLLSEVLENAAGTSFQKLVKERVWTPSEVRRVEFDNPTSATLKNVTTFYEPTDDGFTEAPAVDNSCKFGAGAINATPGSVAKIFSDFYGGGFTSRNMLGRFIPAISRNQEAVSFGGEGMGGRSALVAYPADELVVVVTANARGGELVRHAHEIAALVVESEQ